MRFTRSVQTLIASWLVVLTGCFGEPVVSRPPPAGVFDYGDSPRDDAEAELLALELGGGLLATDDDYERIRRDLSLIRVAQPQVTQVRATLVFEPSELLVEVDNPFDAFDELNRFYQAEVRMDAILNDLGFVLVVFPGRLNIPLIAREYAALPGVRSAEANGFAGESTQVMVQPENSDAWRYVFIQGLGDCPSGCLCDIRWSFTVNAVGGVRQIDLQCRDPFELGDCSFPDFCP